MERKNPVTEDQINQVFQRSKELGTDKAKIIDYLNRRFPEYTTERLSELYESSGKPEIDKINQYKNYYKMKKYISVILIILVFLISSRLIYEERYYQTKGITKIEITQKKYNQYERYNRKGGSYLIFKEREYDYLMGGIISSSICLLLLGYNYFKKK